MQGSAGAGEGRNNGMCEELGRDKVGWGQGDLYATIRDLESSL